MLCTQLHLVKTGDGYTDVKPLPCRSWQCEHCQPRRRAQLMALAASGKPNKCLTLTISSAVGANPVERYKLLHSAWKALTKRILRNFAIAPERRWLMRSPDGYEYHSITNYNITAGTKAKEYTALHYMAFAEETKRGEPHLHILLRSPYIPQDWLSHQMKELLNSPVVWIDRIKNTKAAIGYVSKYVTKSPAQFGTSRRYWVSRKYEIGKGEHQPKTHRDLAGVRVVRETYQELQERVIRQGLIPVPSTDGWIRLHTLRSARREWGDPDDGPMPYEAWLATAWVAKARRELGLPDQKERKD